MPAPIGCGSSPTAACARSTATWTTTRRWSSAPRKPSPKADKPKAEKTTAPPKSSLSPRKRLAALEEKIARFEQLIARVDKALGDGAAFQREPAKAAQLARQRGELTLALAQAEDDWLAVTAEQDAAE